METATTTTGNRRPEGPWISGIVPPICTPFTADLEVDVSSLERLIAFLIEEGVSGLFFLGSSGETAFLTDAQRDQVVEVAVKTVAGAGPRARRRDRHDNVSHDRSCRPGHEPRR